MAGEVEVKVDASVLQILGKTLKAEADGALLRKDLIADLRLAVVPGVSAVKSKLSAIPHPSAASASPALGSYLATQVKSQVRLSGRSAGVKVRVRKTPNVRNFAQAAKRLNRSGWRHKVFGRDVWVEQVSPIPGYFDRTLMDGKPRYRAAVLAAIAKMQARLSSRLP